MEGETSQRAAATGAGGPGAEPPAWAALPDEELLRVRVCDLRLRLQGSPVEPSVDRLCSELEARGLRFRPRFYLATEWLCPDKVPAIGIPFCLAHPRLRQLEQSMMLEVEGGDEEGGMRLLRHEAGHAFNYAYRLYRRTRWRELFGPFSAEYQVHAYYPRPYSRQYVTHLPDNYAQAHPDEDFAETFAVWLTPGLDWRAKYRGWGALRKLEYVDHLVAAVGKRAPAVADGPLLWPARQVRATLASYYRRKRRDLSDVYPGYYDPDLLRLFARTGTVPAGRFLSRHRAHLRREVGRWAHVRRYSVDNVVARLAGRSRELGLYLRGTEHEALLHVAIYLAGVICDRREEEAARAPAAT